MNLEAGDIPVISFWFIMINNTDGANQVGFSSGNILEYVFDMYLA
jgi:hypothetical protein